MTDHLSVFVDAQVLVARGDGYDRPLVAHLLDHDRYFRHSASWPGLVRSR